MSQPANQPITASRSATASGPTSQHQPTIASRRQPARVSQPGLFWFEFQFEFKFEFKFDSEFKFEFESKPQPASQSHEQPASQPAR